MRLLIVFVAVGGLGLVAAVLRAGDAPAACAAVETRGTIERCGCCGRQCECEKHCRLECGTKEIKKYVWVVTCADFCAPLPNCACHDGCCDGSSVTCSQCAERGCKKCDPCAAEKNKQFIPPKCGKVREVKKLEKKEVVCKVPSYKCVVVYCCPQCSGEPGAEKSAPAPTKAPSQPLPPPPAPAPNKTAQNRL